MTARNLLHQQQHLLSLAQYFPQLIMYLPLRLRDTEQVKTWISEDFQIILDVDETAENE